jgi:hypothetical protein
MILTLLSRRLISTHFYKNHLTGGPKNVRSNANSARTLEIPMAVTEVFRDGERSNR